MKISDFFELFEIDARISCDDAPIQLSMPGI